MKISPELRKSVIDSLAELSEIRDESLRAKVENDRADILPSAQQKTPPGF